MSARRGPPPLTLHAPLPLLAADLGRHEAVHAVGLVVKVDALARRQVSVRLLPEAEHAVGLAARLERLGRVGVQRESHAAVADGRVGLLEREKAARTAGVGKGGRREPDGPGEVLQGASEVALAHLLDGRRLCGRGRLAPLVGHLARLVVHRSRLVVISLDQVCVHLLLLPVLRRLRL